MRDCWHDLAFGARTALKAPAATVAIVATLAFGIAANSVAFSLLNSFFIRPLPIEQPEQLVRIYSSQPSGMQYFTVSYADYADMRELTGVFSGVLVEEPVPTSVRIAGTYERVWGEQVSEGYFSLLGVRPAHGRFFAPDEDGTPGGPPVVVLGYGLWQRRFGRSGNVLGETVILDGHPFKIIGVAPKGFQGTNLGLFPDLWLPVARQGDALNRRGGGGFFAVGRLKPGVGIGEARAALDLLARRLQRAYPASNRGIRFTALPESEGRVHPMVRGGLLGFSGVLIVVALVVLLLACANVAAVLLARGMSRRKEVGVRLALGATRGRIIRQLLTEGAFLSLLAGGIGLALAWMVTTILSAVHLPPARGAPLTFDLGLDVRVLGFSFLVTVFTGMLFGLTPALEASRSDLLTAIKGGAGRGFRRSHLRNALVAAQVAFSMVLLIGAGLFLRSLQNAYRVDVGFQPAGVVMMSVDLAPRGYGLVESRQYWRGLIDQVSALPRTQSVSLADKVPLEVNITTTSLAPEGYQPPADGGWPSVDFAVVDSGYFRTLDIPLVEGRDIGERDSHASAPVVIVNEVLARRFWPGTSAVGKRLFPRAGRPYEVIGVARRGKYLTLGEDPKPYIYFPLRQTEARTMTVVARGSGDPATFLREVRDTVRALDDAVPLYNVTTMAEQMSFAFIPATAGAAALNVVGLIALVLTSLGLYGTVAYTASRRTYEIGVRRALGAQNGHVVWLVVRQAVLLVALGVAGGTVLGFLGSLLLRSLLYGVDTTDPVVFSLAPAVLVLVCLVAAWVPTARATRIDAAHALRHE